MRTLKIGFLLIIGLLITTLTSCEKDEPQGPGPEDNSYKFEVGASTSASFFGTIIDENHNAVAGASISIGSSSSVTDANGVFFIENALVNKNHAYIKAEKNGFFLGSRSVVPTSGVNNIKIMLLQKQSIGSFDASTGGSVSGNGVSIEFQDGIVDAAGNAYTGMVNVAAKFIDPTSSDFFDYMPGNLIGADASGGRYLESYGMAAIELTDGSGNELQPAAGKTAEVSFSLNALLMATAPATIPMWHFDELKGYWILEGTATLSGGAYIANVSHFSFWNCDIPTDYVIINGQINEGGAPLPGVIVKIVSTGFGTGQAITDASGSFSGIVPANNNLTLEVWFDCGAGLVLLSSQSLGMLAVNTTLSPVSVVSGGTTIAVSGSVVDCGYSAVANGYISYDGGKVAYLSGGNFSVLACTGTTLDIQAYDLDNLTESGLSTYVLGGAATFNVGQLVACNAITEYIQWSVNGIGFLASTNFNYYEQGSFAGFSGNTPNIFEMSFNTFTGVGAYVWDNSGATYLYGEGIGSIASGSVAINITQFGNNPGDLIEGDFSGSIMANDSLIGGPLVSQSISGNIHFFRN
jgi:hypothetical protein